MKATRYFRTAAKLTAFATAFAAEHPDHWYLRTTLRCDHVINENRSAIVLVNNETIVQRIIMCRTCNVHGNSLEVMNNVQPEKAL